MDPFTLRKLAEIIDDKAQDNDREARWADDPGRKLERNAARRALCDVRDALLRLAEEIDQARSPQQP